MLDHHCSSIGAIYWPALEVPFLAGGCRDLGVGRKCTLRCGSSGGALGDGGGYTGDCLALYPAIMRGFAGRKSMGSGVLLQVGTARR